MKYRVILADDEPEVLRSIQRSLDWEKHGFTVVGAFSNGIDVLEFLENQDADIIFTDIRMPFMDGMELLRKIKERYSYIKSVVISGYDDFQYAREALVNGALDYVLKPVNASEMSEVLKKVKEKMDDELEQKKNIQSLRKIYQENQPIIRENFLNQLVLGNIKEKNLLEEIQAALQRPLDNHYFTVALIQIYHFDKTGVMDRQLASVYIRNLIRTMFCDIRHETFYNTLGECVLFGMDEPEDMEKILRQLNFMTKESWRVMKIGVAVGVGRRKEELTWVQDSFEEAKEALSYRKMSQDNDVIYMDDIDLRDQKIVLFDEKAQDKLFTAVKFGKEDDVVSIIERIRNNLIKENMTRNGCQTYCMSIFNALMMFVRQQNLNMDGNFGTMPDYMKVMQEYGEADIFLEWLEKQCLYLNACFGKERENKTKDIIEEAKKKIQQEYVDPDIGLEKIAAEVGLTQTYFSSLFKKETGMSFVEFLTEIRMQEAMRLLKETDEKIYVVGSKVGYPESGYFSHVFKKKYGMSPLQCRRQGR